MLTWRCAWLRTPSHPVWRLNNLLLESTGVAESISLEIEAFFHHNEGTAGPIWAWEAFKAFIKGLLISDKIYRDRTRRHAVDE